jgi:divalent metal cation (Fe/Co/Zn/Cd) transporter
MASRNIPVKNMTTGSYFQTILMLHLALTVGQTVFAGMALLITHAPRQGGRRFPKILDPDGGTDLYFYVGLGLAFALIATGHFLFRSRVERAKELDSLTEMLTTYRSAVLVRDALANSVGALATVAYMVTQNPRFLSISGLVILVFLVWWPNKQKTLDLLGLDALDPNRVIGDADREGIPRSQG